MAPRHDDLARSSPIGTARRSPVSPNESQNADLANLPSAQSIGLADSIAPDLRQKPQTLRVYVSSQSSVGREQNKEPA
jgi:hypothetical protein